MRSPQTGARAHAPQQKPIKLDANSQDLHKQLCAFRTQAVNKTTKF
jgi:hypothetical protein